MPEHCGGGYPSPAGACAAPSGNFRAGLACRLPRARPDRRRRGGDAIHRHRRGPEPNRGGPAEVRVVDERGAATSAHSRVRVTASPTGRGTRPASPRLESPTCHDRRTQPRRWTRTRRVGAGNAAETIAGTTCSATGGAGAGGGADGGAGSTSGVGADVGPGVGGQAGPASAPGPASARASGWARDRAAGPRAGRRGRARRGSGRRHRDGVADAQLLERHRDGGGDLHLADRGRVGRGRRCRRSP